MRKYILLTYLLFFNAFSISVFCQAITIFTIGDSTMADKTLENDNQERGWVQMLPMFFDANIRIDNRAANGRSSKSFIDEGRWDKVISDVTEGDYVFIQFGHNDEKNDGARHTIPGTTFDKNLQRFIEETRAKGGIPILFNSIVRRNFNENGILIDTHGDYLKSPQNVANEFDVFFIDLNKLTHNLVQNLGDVHSKAMYMWVGEKEDNTHLNINGAYQVAKLAAKSISECVPELSKHIQYQQLKIK